MANTAIWTGVVMLGWWGIFVAVRKLRRCGPHDCKHCGYSLIGIDSTVCPECGGAVAR